MVTIMDTFFLGMGNLVVRAEQSCPPYVHTAWCSKSLGKIDGFYVSGNTFKNGGKMPANVTVMLDERDRKFGTVKDFVMLGNTPDDGKKGNTSTMLMAPKALRATRSLSLKAATRWDFNFSDVLLFGTISEVRYSITIEGKGAFARHAARPAVGCAVAVETDEPVNATVTLTAIQGEYSAGNEY